MPDLAVPWRSGVNELSAHNACSVQLAERLGLPLATLDQSLATAARSAGVVVWSE